MNQHAAQYQYLSKESSPRWMNIESYQVKQAKADGFVVRELIDVDALAPSWIVNDAGELGFFVAGHAFFMYKGRPLEYTEADSPQRFRYVETREFGESGPITQEDPAAHDWMTLPGLPKDYDREPQYYLVHEVFGSRQVTKAQWIKAERAAGFYPKIPTTDPDFYNVCATGGFSGAGGISGTIVY